MNSVERQIRSIIEPLILGKEVPAWKCCCGRVSAKKAKAVEVLCWDREQHMSYAWSVRMIEIDNPERGYNTGLSDFISKKKIAEMFSTNFHNNETL